MKPIIETLTYPGISSFRFGEYKEYNFEYPCHVHTEYEFTYFEKGEGKQVIGDDIKYYKHKELIFLGPNLPHSWHVENNKNQNNLYHIFNIQFKEDFLGKDFFLKPEMKKIKTLLDKSRYGIEILGKTKEVISAKIKRIVKNKGFNRILALLEILDILSKSEDTRICSSLGYVPLISSQTEMDRITQVHAYVMDNYLSRIDLSEIAGSCNMTKSAFCHYFKKRTNKSFIKFVNEMRVKHACRLLKETDQNVSSICFESGFNNLSHFNRNFKEIMKSAPLDYRKNIES